VQDLKTLLHELVRVHAHASGIAARIGEALDESGRDRIKTGDKKAAFAYTADARPPLATIGVT
jgi:hypothetical protein